MFSHYQNHFQKSLVSTWDFSTQLAVYIKLLGIVLILHCYVNESIAQQGVNQTNPSVQAINEVSGIVPATAGDIFLPTGDYTNVERARIDVSEEIVPIPVADYTGNFADDVANYKMVVQRWMELHPGSLAQQDDVSQKLIALGYYDTLLKWQMQNNNINKLTK